MSAPAAMMPLEGIRVLDLATWQTGAGGTAMLADLGADVIKIEEPTAGDPGRVIQMLPDEAETGYSLFTEVMNRNKRSVAIDLKRPEGRDLFLQLAEHADVVTENFRVGTMERLGIGFDVLHERNPRLVLASVNGFGPSGPDASMGVFDIMGHSRSGFMYLLSGHGPLRYIGGHGIADHIGATFFAYAALAGLVARSVHDFGQHVWASQLGGLMTVQMLPISIYLATGVEPWTAPQRSMSGLFNVYQAADSKWICLGCTPEFKYWEGVCGVLGRSDLLEDPRFATTEDRAQNASALIAAIAETIAAQPQREWVERFRDAGIPFTPVQEYSDLSGDPQTNANGYIIDVEHPIAGSIRQVGAPLVFSETPPRWRLPAPKIGEHTDEVLEQMLGLDAERISRMHELGVIGPADGG